MVWAWAACVAGIVAFQFAIGRGQSGRKGGVYGALRSDPHAKRRAQHVGTGLMIYVASGWISADDAVVLLLSCALALYCIHIARKHYAVFNKMYVEQLGAIMRPAEINHTVLPGAFYFLVGCGMVIALFPHDVARLAILHLSVGDPAAAVVGSMYGRTRFWPSGKSLEGYVGCFIASATASLVAFIWQSIPESSATALLGKAAIAGLCAAVAEGIDVGGWDDNLSLPLLSALFMICGRLTLGII